MKVTHMYSSFDISKKILELAEKEGRKVDPMKLLKLVYIMHGWHLGFTGEPLINDTIQAWKYGPVIPQLYHTIKRFGVNPVDPQLINLYAKKELDTETTEFVESIWKVYRDMSGIELSARTHKEGTAWHDTYTGDFNVIMTDDDIKAHYQELIRQSEERLRDKATA